MENGCLNTAVITKGENPLGGTYFPKCNVWMTVFNLVSKENEGYEDVLPSPPFTSEHVPYTVFYVL